MTCEGVLFTCCGQSTTRSCLWNRCWEILFRKLKSGFDTKAASLWWTSTCDSNEKRRLIFRWTPRQDVTDSFLKKNSRSSVFGPSGKDTRLEEMMQNAHKAWWRDVKIHRSEDVPWRVKCRRMVEHILGFRKRKLVPEHSRQNQRMGNKGDEIFVLIQKKRRT